MTPKLDAADAVREHIRAILAEEWKAVIDGYADDAVLLLVPGAIVGKAAIRSFFTNLPPRESSPDLIVDQFIVEGDYVLVTYRLAGREGGDTFLVRDGEIVMQSVHLGSQ